MEQLRTLKTIYENGFMTFEEYNERRQQLIDKLTDTRLNESFGPSRTDHHEHTADTGELVPLSLEDEEKGLGRSELLDSGDLFMNEAGLTELFPVGQAQESTRTDMLTMEQKCELARSISKMDAQCLNYIIQMINSTAPNMLRFNEASGEYSFDLSEFDEATLTTLHYYVKTYFTEDTNLTSLKEDTRPNPRQLLRGSSERFVGLKRSASQLTWTHEESREESKRRKEMLEIEETKDSLGGLFEIQDGPSMIEGDEKQENHESSDLIIQSPDNNVKQEPETKKIRIKVKIYRVEKSGTGSKPWKCDSEGCDKAFGDSSNLIKHLRTHTKEKPYVCTYEECGKSYAHSTSLKEHMNTHTGEKPFVCTFEGCGMAFAQNSNLRRHMRVHTGDRPFVCKLCDKAFSQSTNLKSHLLIHKKSEL